MSDAREGVIMDDEAATDRMRLETWLIRALRTDCLPIEFLAALEAAGWAVVPVCPSTKMMIAAAAEIGKPGAGPFEFWTAMLAARPR